MQTFSVNSFFLIVIDYTGGSLCSVYIHCRLSINIHKLLWMLTLLSTSENVNSPSTVRNNTKEEYDYATGVITVSMQESWCIHWPTNEYYWFLEFIKHFSSLFFAIAFLIMLFEYSVISSGIKPFVDIKRENNFVETMSQRIYLICTARRSYGDKKTHQDIRLTNTICR